MKLNQRKNKNEPEIKNQLQHNNTCKPYKLYVTDFSAIICIPNETKALFEKKKMKDAPKLKTCKQK